MLIKHKLVINTAILITSIFAMLILLSVASKSFRSNIKTTQTIGNIESSFLQLRRHEKDFFLRKDLKYITKFDEQISTVEGHISSLQSAFSNNSQAADEINALQNILKEYREYFTEIISSQSRIGLHPKDGLYGQLRSQVHNVESLIGNKNHYLLSQMLQLRRNEKDFMLRLDLKYVERFKNNLNSMSSELKSSQLLLTDKNQIIIRLKDYQTSFLNLVKEQTKLGLDQNNGLQGQMRRKVHQVDGVLHNLIKISQLTITKSTQQSMTFAYTLFIGVLFVSIGCAWLISKSIFSAIRNFKSSIEHASKNSDLTVRINTETNDEFSDMAVAFNNMLNNFRNLIIEVDQSVRSVNTISEHLASSVDSTKQALLTALSKALPFKHKKQTWLPLQHHKLLLQCLRLLTIRMMLQIKQMLLLTTLKAVKEL